MFLNIPFMALILPDSEELSKFASPPIVETVLSVQFSSLINFTNAHVGWFWKNYLGPEWDLIKQAPRIEDQYELFGDDRKWDKASGFKFFTGTVPERHQILRTDKERMIQIQDSRFIYNWKKFGGVYPSFEILLPEFKELIERYTRFIRDSQNPELEINQWEVTYVNHLLRGELWDTPEDWQNIFPWFVTPAVGVLTPSLASLRQKADGFQGDWRLIIGDNLGRLHISLKHVKIVSEQSSEALALQLTARGPLNAEEGIDLYRGFDIGHCSIVESFRAMTSKSAHASWKIQGENGDDSE